MLHRILEEIVEDWMRAVDPYQKQVDAAGSDDAKIFAVISGIADLRILLLKCLFSYAFFFVATNQAYGHLYKELNRANKISGLHLKHDKAPKASLFVEKIRTIRNSAIAHFPSTKAHPIDAFAAMSWEPGGLSWSTGGRPDLEKLSFGSGRFRGTDASGQRVESQDFEVLGVRTAHYQHCLPYLKQYDKMCCDYLKALQAALLRP